MTNLEYFKNAIDVLRKMEESSLHSDACIKFDRFIREHIFGRYRIEMNNVEVDLLQTYYIETLK